jgi:flagellar assembly factor FliW
MQYVTELPSTHTGPDTLRIQVPNGLIGLSNLRSFDVTPAKDAWPFVTLHAIGDDELNFLAMEPQSVIPDYNLELSDFDAEVLGLTDAKDALIYNIVTVHPTAKNYVTANLVAPLVVNRRTLSGKQVILMNSERFSAKHALIDEREIAAVA